MIEKTCHDCIYCENVAPASERPEYRCQAPNHFYNNLTHDDTICDRFEPKVVGKKITVIKPCPFCGSQDITMTAYDFGRTFTDNIDADTETVIIECECGCGLEVDVTGIIDPEKKRYYAEHKWNTRAKHSTTHRTSLWDCD